MFFVLLIALATASVPSSDCMRRCDSLSGFMRSLCIAGCSGNGNDHETDVDTLIEQLETDFEQFKADLREQYAQEEEEFEEEQKPETIFKIDFSEEEEASGFKWRKLRIKAKVIKKIVKVYKKVRGVLKEILKMKNGQMIETESVECRGNEAWVVYEKNGVKRYVLGSKIINGEPVCYVDPCPKC